MDTVKAYWGTAEQFSIIPFYQNTVKWNRVLHILRFPHFGDNKNDLMRQKL